MMRYLLFGLTILFSANAALCNAQDLRGQSFESVLPVPASRDSLRLWHRYMSDSTVVLLLPEGANPLLKRGYELAVPIGHIVTPVTISLSRNHRDSLFVSCTASDYLSSGYRFLFCREGGQFAFRGAAEFQIFHSGVERVCNVPVQTRDRQDRRIITPLGGISSCTYLYHRQQIATAPGRCNVYP